MHNIVSLEPIDYLIIGHITQDITPNGLRLGGTASYAALTAKAFGSRVGVVTACAADLDLKEFEGISVSRKFSPVTSTFENIHTPTGRIQHVHHVAETIYYEDVPEAWRDAPIVHLGPIAHEADPGLAQKFPDAVLGITPQGCLRGWNENGQVFYKDWDKAAQVLPHATAAVMSIEDVRGNEEVISEFVTMIKILVVTEGPAGSRVYWNGDLRHFSAPKENEVDPVGAGDIFATSFFIRYEATRDPWEAARFATLIAANSVTRKTLSGVPTPEEIQKFKTEVIEHSNL